MFALFCAFFLHKLIKFQFLQFDPLLVESKKTGTVVLMLKSEEEEVLSKACEAIYKFADKC